MTDKSASLSTIQPTHHSTDRSYTLLCIAPVAGPQCPEAQGVMDDLCNMLINRRHDCSAAEKYARSNYQALTDKKLGDDDLLLLSIEVVLIPVLRLLTCYLSV